MKTKQLFSQGADEALLYTTRIQFHADGDLKPHRVRTSDEDLAREVMAIEKMMQRLTKTKRQLFCWPPKPRHRLLTPGAAPLSEDFLRVLRSGLGWIRQAFPHHQLHPLIELFEKHMEARLFSANFRPLCQDDVDRLNSCVKAIRDEASSKVFRQRRDRHHKLVRSNTQGLLELTDRLFTQHSQILVVRIDLSYRRHASMPWLSHPITEEEALNQRDEMIRYLRRKCPFKPVGYAWKLEFTEHTGWHTHFLLFFDANLHQRDLAIAEHIGQHWSSVVTQDTGRYFICNYEHYRYRGVGKIDHTDAAKLWALRTLVVPYLTKADYYVRMVLTTKGRTFGRSELTDVPAKKRGRPRTLPSARVSDFVPPTPPSGANEKRSASTKRPPSRNATAIVQPISPRLLADLPRVSVKSSPSHQDDFGPGKPRSEGTGWVV